MIKTKEAVNNVDNSDKPLFETCSAQRQRKRTNTNAEVKPGSLTAQLNCELLTQSYAENTEGLIDGMLRLAQKATRNFLPLGIHSTTALSAFKALPYARLK